MFVISVVSYLSTGLAGCSVNPGNSRGARKLARTSRVIKKNKKEKKRRKLIAKHGDTSAEPNASPGVKKCFLLLYVGPYTTRAPSDIKFGKLFHWSNCFQICANRRIQNSGFLWSFEESCATLLQFFFFLIIILVFKLVCMFFN
jgi:hypothetical protein